jgi:predicted HicB family RNase H-like nuclease
MMNYRGYTGKAEYDDKNNVYTGSVINVKTVIAFHGSTEDEAEVQFRKSVDDYLEWCKEEGFEPERPCVE